MAGDRSNRPLGPAGKPQAQAVAPSPAVRRETAAERMQRVISERAPRFGLSALLDALRALGYGDDEIQLASHPTTAHQASLVQAVRFAVPPQRGVQITLNVGLLAPQSPLPSYFQQAIERQREGALTGFLNFFAHHLLSQTVQGQFPERSGDLFPQGPEALTDLRNLLGLRTTYALHWIFDHVFPELGVSVARVHMLRAVATRSVRLGPWELGDGATLGGQAHVPVSGASVSLFADDAVSSAGQPWPKEAERRLREQIVPVLQGHGIHLRLALILRDQRNFLVLRPQEFLGYAPLYAGPSARPLPRSARTIILWNGELPSSSSPSSST